jgi:hypothetical protein
MGNVASSMGNVTSSSTQVYGNRWIVLDKYTFTYGKETYTGADYLSFALFSHAEIFSIQQTVQVYFLKSDPTQSGFSSTIGADGWIAGVVIFTLLSACAVPGFFVAFWQVVSILCVASREKKWQREMALRE